METFRPLLKHAFYCVNVMSTPRLKSFLPAFHPEQQGSPGVQAGLFLIKVCMNPLGLMLA